MKIVFTNKDENVISKRLYLKFNFKNDLYKCISMENIKK